MPKLRQFLPPAALLWLVGTVPALATDPREVWDGDTRPWLASVGKLTVPGTRIEDGYSRHYIEDCSATLVRLPDAGTADVIVTAWHCLADYRDLSKPILFTLRAADGDILQRSARRLADGGGMHADWAILRLDQPIVGDHAMAIAGLHAPTSGARLVLAGYSGDPGIGDNGRELTFHDGCRLTSTDEKISRTDCLAFKGASGGAVFTASSGGDALLVGVVSEGDGESTSTYVPLQRLRTPLDLYLGATAPQP